MITINVLNGSLSFIGARVGTNSPEAAKYNVRFTSRFI